MPVKEGVDIETGGAGDAEMRRDEIEDQKAPNGTWWSRTLSLLVQKVRGTQCTHTMQVVAQERVLCSSKRTRRSCPIGPWPCCADSNLLQLRRHSAV